MRLRRLARSMLWVGCFSFLSATQARAQTAPSAAGPSTTADELIANGVAFRKSGQDIEALAAFERAYALHPTARATAQIALAHQALAHWREAERGLLAALNDHADPWVASYRSELEQSLVAVQAHLAWLLVESNVTDSELWIAGQFAGRLPMDDPARVPAGELTIEVRAPGYPPMERHLSADAASRTRAAFVFGPSPTEARPTGADEPSPHAQERGTQPPRRGGWIALGVGSGFAVVGVASMITREVEANIWNDDRLCGPVGTESRTDRCGTNRHIGVAAESIGIAAFATSGATLAIAGWLLLRSSPAASGTTAHAMCGFDGTGVTCAGTF